MAGGTIRFVCGRRTIAVRERAVRFPPLLVLLALACDARPPRDAAPADAPDTLAFEPFVGRLVTLTARLRGDALRLLFDSGGGETLLSPQVADRIPCTPAGRSVGMRMSGELVEWPLCHDVTLEFGGREIVDAVIGIWDVAGVLPEGLPPLDGVASLETFRHHAVTLNLASSHVVVETEESLEERMRSMVPVPMRIATGMDGTHLTVLLEGRVGGSSTTGWFLVDSGNLAETLVAPHLGATPGDSSTTITFGDSVAVSVPTRTEDIIYDGALSEALLRQLIITFDLPSSRAWVARAY